MTETVKGLQAALAERYVLERELGRGGMATVLELGAVLGAERFLREIHLTVTLRHPHILHHPGGSHEHHGNT